MNLKTGLKAWVFLPLVIGVVFFANAAFWLLSGGRESGGSAIDSSFHRRFEGRRIFIAANLYNNEEIGPHWITELKVTVTRLRKLGVKKRDIFVSIYESGSTDSTPKLLTKLGAAFGTRATARGERVALLALIACSCGTLFCIYPKPLLAPARLLCHDRYSGHGRAAPHRDPWPRRHAGALGVGRRAHAPGAQAACRPRGTVRPRHSGAHREAGQLALGSQIRGVS